MKKTPFALIASMFIIISAKAQIIEYKNSNHKYDSNTSDKDGKIARWMGNINGGISYMF